MPIDEVLPIASLNHPNIGQIHGLEEVPSTAHAQGVIHRLAARLLRRHVPLADESGHLIVPETGAWTEWHGGL